MQPGRNCPLHYRTAPARLAGEPDVTADTLYIAGGLYGNLPALETLLDMAANERGSATLIFNGDFNWFDVDADTYSAINHEVLRHVALRGNVETEIAGDDPAAGCGCAYPEWVTDAEVQRYAPKSRAIARRMSSIRSKRRGNASARAATASQKRDSASNCARAIVASSMSSR